LIHGGIGLVAVVDLPDGRMPITKLDKQELDQIHSDHCDTHKGCKEDYFACLYLTKKFRTQVQEIARQCSFGNNDYGIDAYHIDREGRNLYLYQFKWSEQHHLFKESLDRLAKDGMEMIFGNALQDPEKNELLRNLKADLYEHQSLIQRVFVQFIFKGDIDAAENSRGLRDRRENLENKKYLLQKFFNNPDLDLRVEFFSDKGVRRLPAPPPNDSHTLAFTDPARVQTADGQRTMYVGFVPLLDLYRIYKCLGQRLLSRNIRSGLSSDNPPNTKIREAMTDIVMKRKVLPDVFAFNHNGVTLAAERIDFEDGHAVVKVPRLLNGAQTITSVAKFLEDNDGNPLLKSNADVLEGIKVLAKIVVDDPFSNFVTNVTICNNRQNPVEPWNLRANDRIQCDLHDKLKEEVSIFYSRQDNAFRNLSNEELEELGIPSHSVKSIRYRDTSRFGSCSGVCTNFVQTCRSYSLPSGGAERARGSVSEGRHVFRSPSPSTSSASRPP
jgi:hypothetical protein